MSMSLYSAISMHHKLSLHEIHSQCLAAEEVGISCKTCACNREGRAGINEVMQFVNITVSQEEHEHVPQPS